MQIIDLPLEQLKEAPWNANQMDGPMLAHLRESIKRYGLIQNLVVRPVDSKKYEVLSGNQRLKVLKETGLSPVSCIVVNLDDIQARLLAQALNHIHGADDLGLRAENLRKVLENVSEEEIMSLLPGTKGSLNAFTSLNQDTVVTYLQKWEDSRAARLKHYQFQLTSKQSEVVEEALVIALPSAKREHGDSPNIRGTALYLICKKYLETEK